MPILLCLRGFSVHFMLGWWLQLSYVQGFFLYIERRKISLNGQPTIIDIFHPSAPRCSRRGDAQGAKKYFAELQAAGLQALGEMGTWTRHWLKELGGRVIGLTPET